MKKKVLFRTNELSPYRVPLFEMISNSTKIDFKVILNSCEDNYKNWRAPVRLPFNYEIIPGYRIYFKRRGSYYSRRVIYLNFIFLSFLRFKPDVIISQDFSLPSFQAYLYSKIFHCKYYTFTEATSYTERKITWLQKFIRKFIISRSHCHIVTSSDAADYIRSFPRYSENIIISHQTSDVLKLKENVNEYRKCIKCIPNTPCHILYVGQLVVRKGIWQLMQAIMEIRKKGYDFVLDLIGDGNLSDKLIVFINNNNLNNHVRFHGWIPYEKLYMYFAMGEIFILPTLEDTYAVVINEAMAAGLPIIASKYAGGTRDMVRDGINGFIIDPNDVNRMTECIIRLISDVELRKRFGENSVNMIEQYTVEKSAEKIIEAVGLA